MIHLGQTFEEWINEDVEENLKINLQTFDTYGISWDDIPDEEDLTFWK